jgi:holo-[acyl-carrier protein] synthase
MKPYLIIMMRTSMKMTTNEDIPILGIGNDIIEIERIRKSIDNHGYRLISRLFSRQEQDYCLKHKDPVPHFAGRFAGKEAIVKALGTGFGEHASWLDMEIVNDAQGKPCVTFSKEIVKRLNNPCVLVSISHCQQYASAFAVWVNRLGGGDK